MSKQNIQIIDFLRSITGERSKTTEPFVASHGMSFQHICPCSQNISNGPRAIGPVTDGYPKRMLGGADSLGIHYKDTSPVLSQKQVRIVNFSRTCDFPESNPVVRL